MGTQSIVFGRIQLYGHREPYGPARAFIVNLPEDKKYPQINARNFTPGAEEYEPSYGEPVFGFAGVYKYLEDSFLDFLIKFEYILRHIEFSTVKLELQPEFYSECHFFWKRKHPNDRINPEDRWEVMEDWYFGEGPRSLHGTLDDSWDERDKFWHSPLEFDATLLARFNEFLLNTADVAIGEKIYLEDHGLKSSAGMYPILTYLETYKEIEFGWENYKYWMKKRQAIPPLVSARVGRGHLRKNERNEQSE